MQYEILISCSSRVIYLQSSLMFLILPVFFNTFNLMLCIYLTFFQHPRTNMHPHGVHTKTM